MVAVVTAPDVEASPDVTENHDYSLKYKINDPIEAKDERYNDNKWYKGRVIKLDSKKKTVLVHFLGFSKRYDMWIPENSNLLKKSSSPMPKRTSRLSNLSSQSLTLETSDSIPIPKTLNGSTPSKKVEPKIKTPLNEISLNNESSKSFTPSNRRSAIQIPFENPAEASPPPINAPTDLNVNNETTLAPTFFKTRKVVVNSVLKETLIEENSAKRPKMSPTSVKNTIETISNPNSKLIKSPKAQNHSNSVNKQPKISDCSLENQSRENTLTENHNLSKISLSDTPKAKDLLKIRSAKDDLDLINKFFNGLVSIDSCGQLSCNLSNCSVTSHNPHLMKFHLEMDHPEQYKKTSISVVIPPKSNNPNTTPVHKGSIDLFDIKVNCVCQSVLACGFLIRCSLCNLWQHGDCISLTESNPPSIYLCFDCIVKPDSSSSALNPVYVTTVSAKNASNGLKNQPASQIPSHVNAFTISHSIDTYRSICKKISKILDSPTVNADNVLSELKFLQQQLIDNKNQKLEFEKMRKNIDNLIFKL